MNKEIEKILFEGTSAQRRFLFSFNKDTSPEEMVKKFNLYSRYFHPKFFKSKDAPFHQEILLRLARLYKGVDTDFLDIGFRGCSKTTYTKLFLEFCVTCDEDHSRRFLKVLCEDIKNSKQIVTDIYNLLIQPRISQHFPEVFEKTDYKREETMERFTTSTGVKIISGSVGQEQRGQIQEADRPDFLWFDDIESRNTLRSATKTVQIWDNMQEAISGLAFNGVTTYTANYISERGNVHRLVEKVQNKMIVPIADEDGEPTWDRYTREHIDKIRADADDFEGEYLCKPSASKDVLFDRESIDSMPVKRAIKTVAGFKIFKEYNAADRIAGGHDVALGVGLDSSTSVFINFDIIPCQVVATYHNNLIKPADFGDEIARQGGIFGECLLAPEKNNAGISTIDRLKQIYPMSRIHATQRKAESIRYGQPTEFGWDTNGVTKSKMFNDLATAVEKGWLQLNDEDLIREARGYTRNDVMDKEEDPRMVTRHFDLLTACAIAWQMKDFAVKGSGRGAKYVDPFADLVEKVDQHFDTTYE
jgi:hypothetical protein